MSEDESMNEDELINKKKLVMQKVPRDAEAVKSRRSGTQRQCAEEGEHYETEMMEDRVCFAGRDSFMTMRKATMD